jgi:hypothetical protein
MITSMEREMLPVSLLGCFSIMVLEIVKPCLIYPPEKKNTIA